MLTKTKLALCNYFGVNVAKFKKADPGTITEIIFSEKSILGWDYSSINNCAYTILSDVMYRPYDRHDVGIKTTNPVLLEALHGNNPMCHFSNDSVYLAINSVPHFPIEDEKVRDRFYYPVLKDISSKTAVILATDCILRKQKYVAYTPLVISTLRWPDKRDCFSTAGFAKWAEDRGHFVFSLPPIHNPVHNTVNDTTITTCWMIVPKDKENLLIKKTGNNRLPNFKTLKASTSCKENLDILARYL